MSRIFKLTSTAPPDSSYEDFLNAGWSDAQMVTAGFLELPDTVKAAQYARDEIPKLVAEVARCEEMERAFSARTIGDGSYKSRKKLNRETELAEKALRTARGFFIADFARERHLKIVTCGGYSPLLRDDVIDMFSPKSAGRGWCNSINLFHTRASWEFCIAEAKERDEIVSQVSNWSWYGPQYKPMLFSPARLVLKMPANYKP